MVRYKNYAFTPDDNGGYRLYKISVNKNTGKEVYYIQNYPSTITRVIQYIIEWEFKRITSDENLELMEALSILKGIVDEVNANFDKFKIKEL